MRIIFCGTPDYAVPSLKALLRQSRHGHEVVAVVSQPDRPKGRSQTPTPPPVVAAALEMNFPRERIFQPKSLNGAQTLESLRILQPDLLCVVAYGNLLKQKALSLPRILCLNAHGSLLPRYRGASPIQAALLNGEKTSGVSMMKMELGLDTGPVLFKRDIPIASEETAGTLHDKLAELSADCFVESLQLIESGSYPLIVQDESLSSYAPKLEKSSGTLLWNHSAHALECFVRAMTPWPGAWASVSEANGSAESATPSVRLRIAKASVFENTEQHSDRPSTDVTIGLGVVQGTGETQEFHIDCGCRSSESGSGAEIEKSVLRILRIQPEGKREMSVSEYLRGAGKKLSTRSLWK
jgi:methionyl-tRNA formyltransferase